MVLGRSLLKRRAVHVVGGVFVFAILSFGVAILRTPVPTFAQTRSAYRPSDKWIIDRNGIPMESVRTGLTHRSLDWAPAREISVAFQRALIATEDRRFRAHHGVDFLALASGALTSVRDENVRGASTITMQVYDLLTGAKSRRSVTLIRKLRQIVGAFALERAWSKDEILEAYVNLVAFRGETVGLRAASFGFFNKAPSALDENESALLVALIRAPNAAVTRIAKRACQIRGAADCSALTSLASRAFSAPYQIGRERDWIPVLSHRFISPSSGGVNVIATTLDSRVQRQALEAVREQMRELRDKNVGDAAVVVLDTKSGEILAYVANAGPGFASATQVDGASMRRQAGSTLKPFVYGTAYDMRLTDLSALVEDSPEDLGVGAGSVYNPRNYDQRFIGFVSTAEALASSLNVPAVRTLMLVGEGRVLERMRDLGFTALQDEEHYGPSLALGTVDVSLVELTEAYRRLSLYSDSRVFSDATKQQLFSALSLPEYRRFTFGLSNLLTLPFPAAVKTGTSKDMRDNWCIGYTSEYTVGVWVGNFDGQPMWNVSGMTGATPIWSRLMTALHKRPPLDLASVYVPPAPRLEKPTIARIRYPQPDMLIGFDADIPRASQKLPIKVEHPQPGQVVYINGLRVSAARELTMWSLKRGRHNVELRTAQGRVVDRVKFTVR